MSLRTMSPSSTIAIPAGSNWTVEVESPFTMLTRATAESAMTGSSTSSVWKAWELHEHNQINNIKIQTRCIKTYIPQLEKQGHLHASRQVGLEVQLYVYCQYRSDPGKRQNCLSGLKDKSTDERGEEIWSKKKFKARFKLLTDKKLVHINQLTCTINVINNIYHKINSTKDASQCFSSLTAISWGVWLSTSA